MRNGLAVFLLAYVWFVAAVARGETATFTRDHVTVNYDGGIDRKHAEALARVTNAARRAAVERFGFDVPQRITIDVRHEPNGKARLWTDGADRFTLVVTSPDDLAPPATSGVFHVYGMCHELGHVVMYRPIPRHDWLTGDGAEGWAHYFGSRVVDDVYASEGPEVWATPYDYRADGMRRLESQLGNADRAGDKTVVAAGLWKELAETIGEKRLAPLFASWGKVQVDAANPSAALRRVLLETSGESPAIAKWWDRAEPVMVQKRPRSTFLAATRPAAPGTRPASGPAAAKGATNELAHDDGKSAGKSSVAGGGHAVAFEAPGDNFTLTAVKIYGSRYGAPQPPADDFNVWLCDADGKTIKEFTFPYKVFLRGDPRWVTLKTEPTVVPKQFIVCVGFNPTATKGVFVHFDAAHDGDSRSGLPGGLGDAFGKGDWMIRAVGVPAD